MGELSRNVFGMGRDSTGDLDSLRRRGFVTIISGK
jgi:hypothetical protein